MREIKLPIDDETIRSLHAGDAVLLSGVMMTGRDAVHKWMIDTFIRKTREPQGDDLEVYEAIKKVLDHSVLYHCGPVVAGLDTGDYRFVAAGPTTSIREEPYEAEVIHHFHLRGVMGKGGMGPKTLKACQEEPAVYFHAVGGAATLIAQSVQRVLAVYKLEFGVPEAMWVIEVKDFPAIVTMDSHGKSLHEDILEMSEEKLKAIIGV